MTLEMGIALIMGLFDVGLAVFLVWLLVHGRRAVRQMDAEFERQRQELRAEMAQK